RAGSAAPAVLLYLSLGVMVYSTSALTAASATRLPPLPAARTALRALVARIDALPFAGPHTAPLLRALLAGDRTALPLPVIAAFRAAGASHLLALSGLHLGIIYAILSGVLSLTGRFPPVRVARSCLIIAALGFYTVITGASPSLVRAFLFVIVAETARHFPGRAKTLQRVLPAALLFQLLFSPLSISSAGFQLSYLAMAGIALVYPRIRDWYPAPRNSKNPFRFIWNSAALSFSCQVFTAPLAAARFGTFAPHFMLTNLIALPLTEALMLCALVCIALRPSGLLPAVTDFLSSLLLRSLEIISTM
ncbi:MAG: ComEC/Rec2 family competence protein, partial [Bacteroidales bacterium]|nr:ComEC/Rec2 family competence protein [Bacteroidales bacterium]